MHLLVGKPWAFLTQSSKNVVGQVYLVNFVTSLTINLVIKESKSNTQRNQGGR